MAEKEAAEMLQAKLTCMKLEDLSCVGEGCSRDCNDCEYNYKQGTIEEHEKALELAIKALKEIQQYRAIGTVEECREAVEKQKSKKPVLRNDNGKLRKSCPVCGCFFSPLSRSCPKCGQAIQWDEN